MGAAHKSQLVMVPAVAALFAADATAATALAIDSQVVADLAGQSLQLVHQGVSEGYRVAPALMLGLMVAIAFPFLAISSRIVRVLTRPADATRRYRAGSRWRAGQTEIDGEISASPVAAFVEIEGAQGRRFALARDMFRIGREDDNDIRIASGAVHRYHAAIHREDFDSWHITDLSGADGNGLIVNGRRCSDAPLQDGDLIVLGPGRLRFRAGLA